VPASIRVQPADPALEALVRTYVAAQPWACPVACVALDLGPTGDGRRKIALVQGSSYTLLALAPAGGAELAPPPPAPPLSATSKVEVRSVPRRTIFVDGVPIDPPLRD
jgi:hypothetical protein